MREGSGALGLGIYVSLEREISGADPLAIDGKSLARAQFILDRVALEQCVPSLKSLLCADRKEAIDFLEDIGVDPEEVKLPEEQWHPAELGRRSVASLLEHLTKEPDCVPNAESVRADLVAIDKVLAIAEQQKIKFHFSLDLPL